MERRVVGLQSWTGTRTHPLPSSSRVICVRNGGKGAIESQPVRELRKPLGIEVLGIHEERFRPGCVGTASFSVPFLQVCVDSLHFVLDVVERELFGTLEGGCNGTCLRDAVSASAEYDPGARE